MKDVNIGIKIQASIYVTIKGLDIIVPMDINFIKRVESTENGTIIEYNGTEIYVVEDKESIEKSVGEAFSYKTKCSDYANEIMNEEEPVNYKEQIKEFVLKNGTSEELLGTTYNSYKCVSYIRDVIKNFVIFSIVVNDNKTSIFGVEERQEGVSDVKEVPLERITDEEAKRIFLVLNNTNFSNNGE